MWKIFSTVSLEEVEPSDKENPDLKRFKNSIKTKDLSLLIAKTVIYVTRPLLIVNFIHIFYTI